MQNKEIEPIDPAELDPDFVDPDGEHKPEIHKHNIIEKAGEANLIGHILKCPEVAELSATVLPTKALGVKSHRLIAESANQYWSKYGKLIPPNILELDFVRKISESKSREADYEDFVSVTKTVIESPEYYADQLIDVAKRYGIAKANQQLAKEANEGKGINFDSYFKSLDNAREIGKKKEDMELMNVLELQALPAMEWLIAEHIPTAGTITVYGPSESCKTFYCLEMACCIATGKPFFGKWEVKQKKVCYINSEGKYNLYSRLMAWCTGHNMKLVDLLENICFLPSTCNITELSQCQKLIDKSLKKIGGIDVLFIDTLSRNFGEGDTDNNQDMRLYLRGVDLIREKTGATVVSVHHTGHQGDRETGAKSLRNYSDTSIQVSSTGGTVDVICKKQKDLERFKSYKLDRMKSNGSIWLSLDLTDTDAEDAAELLELIPVLPLTMTPTKENTVAGTALRDQLGIDPSDSKKLTRLLRPLLDSGVVSVIKYGKPCYYYRIEELS